ncbi:sequence-specific DNA binding transcription factors [Striga asiatica]|uniref:Sequence-specific DNA binding transcription factors n=1 Tax=Striga asiatica TaxID=4170 RepID=A0A5A7RFY7_STRAF|nr:sequence-specific DNA binding transcription factors [Striga asiatica]
MDLRRRQRQTFSGFTSGEVQRMQQSLTEFRERALDDDYCKKLAGIFNRSSGRAGKPAINWTEIRTWFQKNQVGLFTDTSCNADTTPAVPPKALTQSTETGNLKLLEDTILPHLNTLTLKLDRQNYKFWRARASFTVRAHGFEDFLLGKSLPLPEFVYPSSPSGSPVSNPEFLQWRCHDKQLVTWPLSSMAECVLGSITRCSTSSQIWSVLETLFCTRSRFRNNHLRLMPQTTREGDLLVEDYIVNRPEAEVCLFIEADVVGGSIECVLVKSVASKIILREKIFTFLCSWLNIFLLAAEIDEDTYDVDTFLSHRYVASGELEVRVKYVGFGAEEAEWVNAKDSVRLRSVALDSSECYKVEAGDHVVCFKEREDKTGYYDANVIDVERRLHDIRGCRCLFSIRYHHDNTEEKVRLRRLCCRPEMLGDEEDEDE